MMLRLNLIKSHCLLDMECKKNKGNNNNNNSNNKVNRNKVKCQYLKALRNQVNK